MSVKGRVMRLDAGELRPAERLPSGFLKVDGRISRIGIQVYQAPNGRVIRELRLPEEVFDEESLKSFALLPMTNSHPPTLLTARTARQFSVGAVGETLRRDGDYVAAPLIIHDASAIAAAEAGRSQLSCGYTCELEEKAGTWEGQEYDHIQRKIRGNHVALVDEARAGPGAAIRLDQIDEDLNSIVRSQEERTRRMKMIKVDGLSLEVTEGTVDAIQQGIDRLAARADKAEKLLSESAEKLAGKDKEIAAVADEKAKIAAQLDAMKKCPDCGGEGKVDGEECDMCEGEGKVEKTDAILAAAMRKAEKAALAKLDARVTLVAEARKHLGDEFKADGMSDVDIRKAVMAKLEPKTKLDGRGEEYVTARFDAAVERVAASATSAASQARGALASVPPPGATHADGSDPGENARQKMLAGFKDAWKVTPASAAK